MSSRKKLIVTTSAIVIITALPAFGDWKEDARAIDISGGEDHTLILTKDKGAWACGPNGGYAFGRYYYGVLGTGSTDYDLIGKTLIRVHGGDMNMPSGFLEDINDIDAGWMHSLALDVNGLVWSWGDNYYGQLGDGFPRGQHGGAVLQTLC